MKHWLPRPSPARKDSRKDAKLSCVSFVWASEVPTGNSIKFYSPPVPFSSHPCPTCQEWKDKWKPELTGSYLGYYIPTAGCLSLVPLGHGLLWVSGSPELLRGGCTVQLSYTFPRSEALMEMQCDSCPLTLGEGISWNCCQSHAVLTHTAFNSSATTTKHPQTESKWNIQHPTHMGTTKNEYWANRRM